MLRINQESKLDIFTVHTVQRISIDISSNDAGRLVLNRNVQHLWRGNKALNEPLQSANVMSNGDVVAGIVCPRWDPEECPEMMMSLSSSAHTHWARCEACWDFLMISQCCKTSTGGIVKHWCTIHNQYMCYSSTI